MKSKILLTLVCSALLLTGCGKKKVIIPITPDANVRYAFFVKCVNEGSAIDLPEEKVELGNPLAHFTLEGQEHYFYAVSGYEFVEGSRD